MLSTINGSESALTDSAHNGRPWRRAAAWLAFLGPFFFLSYGFANWWTGRLSHVDAIWFAWEKQIPFWDWTILPYMSIDAFYAASLFLCVTRVELDTHAKRLLCATLISVVGFLLFPLQFSFIRPATSGFNGALFAALTGFDKPFNQAPSLHVSLLMLLWVVYARHLRGAALWMMHIWFALIGISVFTTFQHHVIDGITGVGVGVFCLYLFPDAPIAWSRVFSADTGALRKLRGRYLCASALCFAFGYGLSGWAWLLVWPGAALLLVGLAYTFFGVTVFQKHKGGQSWPARTLLAPYRIGAWLSSRWFTRKEIASVEVIPGVWIGRAPSNADWVRLRPTAVLDLTAEFNAGATARTLHYQNIPMLDLVAPSVEQLAQAVIALDELRARGPVLVHCALGYSRSAIVTAAWLLHRDHAETPHQAIELVRIARPRIVLSPAFLSVLHAYHVA